MGEPDNNPPPMDDCIIDMVKELEETSPIPSRWSICKVPIQLRSVNKDAYTPHIVSIGPIHHEDEKLLAMEDHKRWYLQTFFKRAQDPKATLEDCCETILGHDADVRACYAEKIPYDKHELAKILLRDAVFLLELFSRYYEYYIQNLRTFENDPIFKIPGMIWTLRRDLALLENQIPYFVLKSVFKYIVPPGAVGRPTLKKIALQFFEPSLNISEEAFSEKSREKGSHLLHLLYNCYLPTKPITVDSRSEEGWDFIATATSLDQAGVEFQENKESNGLFDLQFHNGTLKIPRLLVHDDTDSLFRNLVAFEQFLSGRKHYITSFIILMDDLIDTKTDVHLLQQKRIIENILGSRSDVKHIFNTMRRQIALGDFYFAGLYNEVNAYAKSHRHRHCAALRRDHFKNPWRIISLLGAIILLVLTFLQTLYSLLSYHKQF